MAGNCGMSMSRCKSPAEKVDLNLRMRTNTDDNNATVEGSLSEQLDIEVHKLEEMIRCLESLERALEPRGPNNQTTTGNYQKITAILNKDDVMERGPRSSIPVYKGLSLKINGQSLPGDRPSPSPPIDIPGRVLTDKLAEDDADAQMEEEEESFTESVSVRSAANLFGGQAIIRRIPTPSSRRQDTKRLPPPVPARKGNQISTGSSNYNAENNKITRNAEQNSSVEDHGEVSHSLETNIDDILDQPLESLSDINGISETYDNVDHDENIPSYNQFIKGTIGDCRIEDTADNTAIISEMAEDVTSYARNIARVLPNSARTKEYCSMDFTVVGTITPLNDRGGQNDDLKEEISLVVGRPSSPMSSDNGLKRCLSPSYEPRPFSPPSDPMPSKRIAGNRGTRQSFIPNVSPGAKESKLREITNHVSIMCEGCNNCLLDLKRQALRIIYPESSKGEYSRLLLDSVETLKDKLQVQENGYRFSRAGHCEVCETHVTQLKQEAVSMVQSIQQAQQESSGTTNIPNLIGSVNLPPPSPRKIGSINGPHLRYSSSKIPGSKSFLSKSAPIAAQAQAYLEQNVRSRGAHKRQIVLRAGSQDRPGFYKGPEMYPQGGSDCPGVGQFGRPVNYPISGSHFINTPYMQQPLSMQVYHQQQYQRQQQQQQQQGLSHQQQQQLYHQQQQFGQQSQPHYAYQQQQQFHQATSQPVQQPQFYQQQQQQFHQQQQPIQYQPHQYHYLQYSQAAPGSPSRVLSPPPRIQSPPPRLSGISSPPPSSPSLSRLSTMSPPPSASSSPAASFFARAAQKLGKKKKRHHQHEPELPSFPTKFSEIVRLSPPACPPCLLRSFPRGQLPGMGKVKVMLRVVSTNHHGDQAASCLNIDTRNKQVTVYDPAASGYATSLAHRKAAMAPKMFAFDGVFSPDDCLAEVCSGSLPELIQGVVAGADGCVFSYGYSKLGKTYTMVGDDSSSQTLGLIPCAIAWLFKVINEQKDQTGARFSVRVSAVEVSGKQETLKDLLADVAQGKETGVGTAPGVYLREDPISGTQLENQSELRAPTAEKATFYLDAALNSRTKTEEESRSSHLLFTLHVYQYRIEKENKAGLPGVAGGRSRLHLIDLGSASKSKDPNNVALSLSALGNVIMALLNGQRHVPHRDSKVAQLLRDSLGNITCRTCMIAHVSQEIPHYNESLQVIQLAARIHRMRRRKVRGQFSGTSSDDSSTSDGSSIRSRPYRGFRMGTLHEGSSLSDPDYTSSSESCNTVIYMGHGAHQSLSDRELTDHEGSVRSVPRTNPRLPRRASGSRSSGDEGSNSDSGRSFYRSPDSLSRLHGAVASPVRDVSVTSSRHTTPVRSLSRGTTPIRDVQNSDIHSPLSCSPPSVHFNLPQKSNSRTKPFPGKQDGSNPQCYASVNIVEKSSRVSARPKRVSSSPSNKDEQWIDGPGAAMYPEKKQNTGEQWIDGPSAFVIKPDSKHSKSNTKMSSEEMWVDGPPEMLAENQMDENQNRTPKVVMHTSSKKAHVRSLSSSPKHQSPMNSPAPTPRADILMAKPARTMPEIKERAESQMIVESAMSNLAQPGDSRPNSMLTNVGDDAELDNMLVKPFVKDWVQKHGVVDAENSLECTVESSDNVTGTLDLLPGSFRRPKPHDSRTRKLLPASSTPKQSPHHSPKSSPATHRKIKVQKSNFPDPTSTTKRVTDWLKSVESNPSEETLYLEAGAKQHLVRNTGIKTDVDKEFDKLTASLDASRDISSCSSVYPDTTLNDSRTAEFTDADVSMNRTADSNDCIVTDMSFDSSVDTVNSGQNRDSIYELQMDEQLERRLENGSRKGDDDDDSFSNASCAKDSEMDTAEALVAEMEMYGDMKKSETMQSIKTIVAEQEIECMTQGSVEINSVCNIGLTRKQSSHLDFEPMAHHLLSRKPDGASNPNLMCETFTEKTNVSALREEYLIVNAVSSQSSDLTKRSQVLSKTSMSREGDGVMDETLDKTVCDFETISQPFLPLKPCFKCGYSQENSKPIAKMCKDCQKMVALSIKNSHSSVTRKDKSKYSNVHSSSSSGSSPTSKGSKSKVQSPSHSKLPVFSKNLPVSSKDSKSSRKKEKESQKSSFLSSRNHDSDSGNDSGIVAIEKTLLSPYATITKPRTVSHSSSGHGSDNSSTMSTDLISKQGSSLSDKIHGGTSSGYESMLRESEGSESSTINEESADESSGDKKKGTKKKRLPSTRRSRSAPSRDSESPESSSRKSSPSSKNSSLSPTSKAWQEKHGRLKEEGPLELKEYDADDVKRLTRHRPDEETLRKNHDKIKEILNNGKQTQEIPHTKDTYVVDRSNWSFDCKFLMCFSCRSQKKTDV